MSYLSDSYDLPEVQFALLRDLIHQRLGLFYDNGRRELLQDRLAMLMAERGISSFLDYYYLLKYDPQSGAEWLRLQSALAVRETYFFRESDQIYVAAQHLVPALQRQYPGRTVRIWSAACASGEEPYSLAIALQQAGCYQAGPVEIIATDFDMQALEAARQAVYRERALRSIDRQIRQRYFTPLPDGRLRLDPAISRLVNFSYLNLMDEAGVLALGAGQNGARVGTGSIDLIFCRNVFIYFSDQAIRQVVGLFYQVLRTPGYLFLGAAESLLKFATPFELMEVQKTFVYSRHA